MDKVILTKAQAQVIERLLKRGCAREELVHDHILSGEYSEENKALSDMTPDKLIRALYIGYEVEQTMEERMLAHFKEPKGYLAEYDTENVIYRKGMAKALEIAGIKVPGIND
ncbi:hypothetical protein G7L40_21045 [Paenibacillus polymyxa]|uniref:Uncharacterized protein n=1 Tax=Paenibacillus polymyxa TaxID=1406 RepID=A0A378XZ50_PAEPO|nr:hypothetical protein [Paenibacillus polymyxa]MBE7896021.1 hypothetical protein [Paenibacillus polymyxa]MBG9766017.1 hypothetical protein [Paenibacillus polymyxa]MCC3256557.1 hypothetical protein [Paenibacillus polymyxa]QPK54954.1 hypothetical protein G7035_21095 [Paenibacillus polymyxa]QPK60044.1 hypothetical protein G7L40_21045 [Paenibacillus polymyxa]